jgi:hypothetical protein
MDRKGNYIGGGTIIGPGGSWPTLDPAAPSTEIIPGEKSDKRSRRRRNHKTRAACSALEGATKESFITNDAIQITTARSLIEKRIQQN